MSRIPAQGAVVTVGAMSIFASLCLFGGPAAWSSIDTTSHPLSNAAATIPLSARPVSATAVTGVSNAAALAAATGGFFTLPQQDEPATSDPQGTIAPDSTTGTTVPTGTVLSVGGAPTVAATAATPVAGSVAAVPVKVAAPHVTAKPAVVPKAAAVVTPRSIAETMAASHGWTGAQWICLDKLWQHESKYETTIRNSRSGAYGIPQALPASKMSTAGADWRTNPVTQVRWGLSYIAARYGTPCGAWQHEEYHGSY